MPGARPTTFTKPTVDRVLGAICAGLPYRLAAEAGITPEQLQAAADVIVRRVEAG